MANMSYCRFRNTYGDLGDCANALEDEGLKELSNDERTYAERLYRLCQEYIDIYDEQIEIEEDDEEEEEEED